MLSRREGTSVFYRVADPLVFDLLDTARLLFERHLNSLQQMADHKDVAFSEGDGIAPA